MYTLHQETQNKCNLKICWAGKIKYLSLFFFLTRLPSQLEIELMEEFVYKTEIAATKFTLGGFYTLSGDAGPS